MPRLAILALAILLSVSAAPAAGGGKKHILFIGQSVDYAHDAVSHAMYTIAKLGEQSGAFDVRFHTDTGPLTKAKLEGNRKNLDYFDAIFFYGQGDLPMTGEQKAAVMSFVRDDGKGVLAAHSGTDSFRASWPEYVEMIGGAFNHHPWHAKVRVLVDDREFPATRHFPPSFEITDEIYQLNRYNREKVRVLMRLDTNSVDMRAKNVERTDGDFAVTWAREWGKGRVFTSILGHRPEVWDRADVRKMWLEGIFWALGLTQGETKPLPLPGG